MPDKNQIQQSLYDFDATIKAKPNLSDKELMVKFPEFGNDINKLQAAKDYSATLNSGKYKDASEFNSKFPEFFTEDVKKKDTPSPSLVTQLPSAVNPLQKGANIVSGKVLGDVSKGIKQSVGNVPSKKEEQGWLLNTVSALDKGFYKNVVGNPVKGLGTLLQQGTRKIIGGTGEGFISDALIKFGDSFNNAIDELTPQDESFKNSLSDQFAQAFGQVGSMVATAGFGGAASKGVSAASQLAPKAVGTTTALKEIGSNLLNPSAISAGLVMGQSEFDKAKQLGATDDQAFESFYKNAVTGSVLENIPVMQFMKRFNQSTGGGVANYIKTKGVAGITGGLEEMTTEVLQQLYANKTAKDIYNTNQDLYEGLTENGGIGFGVGFLLNAMGAKAKLLKKEGNVSEAKLIENQVKEFEQKAEAKPSSNKNAVATKIAVLGKETGAETSLINLQKDLENGVIDESQYNEGLQFIEKAAKIDDTIPQEIKGENRVTSIELIDERQRLEEELTVREEQKKSVDVAFHKPLDEANKELAKRMEEINKELGELAKPENNIVNETKEVEVQQPTEATIPTTETVSEAIQPTEEGTKEEVIKKIDFSKKSDVELENRQTELDNAKFDSPESIEFNAIDKELEKREWRKVFDAPLDKVSDIVDELIKKDKEMPNGWGSYIDRQDARQVKSIINKYKSENLSDLTDAEVIKDFKDAMFGKPTTWYSDGLKLRESIKVANERGIDVFDSLSQEFIKDGYSKQDAINMAKRKLEPILKDLKQTPTELPSVKEELVSIVTEEEKMQFGKGYKDYSFKKETLPTNKIKITEQPSLSERKELIDDIKNNGIKEPIMVEYDKENDTYFVKNGNNRLAIAKELGIKEIPTIIAEYNEPPLVEQTKIDVEGVKPLDISKQPTPKQETPSVKEEVGSSVSGVKTQNDYYKEKIAEEKVQHSQKKKFNEPDKLEIGDVITDYNNGRGLENRVVRQVTKNSDGSHSVVWQTIGKDATYQTNFKQKTIGTRTIWSMGDTKAYKEILPEIPVDKRKGFIKEPFEESIPPQAETPKQETKTPSVKEEVDFTAKGGNKVVDEKGEPLVVYHGTNKEFDKLDVNKPLKGLFFTKDKESAKGYANKKGDGGGSIREAKINLKNPHIIDAKGKSYDEIIVDLDKVDMSTGKGVSKKMTTDEIVDALRGRRSEKIITNLYGGKEKADGIIIKNVKDNFTKQGNPTDIYIPFKNEQISEQPTPKQETPSVKEEGVSGVGGDVKTEITKNKARNDRHTELLYKDNKTKEEKAEYNEIDAERFADRKKLIPNASEGRDEMYDDVHDAILVDNEMPKGYSATVTDSYYEPIMQRNHTIAKVTKPNGEQFYVDVNTYKKQEIGKTYGKAVEQSLTTQSETPKIETKEELKTKEEKVEGIDLENGVSIKKDKTSEGFYQVYKDGKFVGLLGATSFEQARNKGQHFDENLMSEILTQLGIEHSKAERSIQGENEFLTIRTKGGNEKIGEILNKNQEPNPTSETNVNQPSSSRTSGEENQEPKQKVEGNEPPKPPTDNKVSGKGESFSQKTRSLYKQVINRSKGLSESQKEILRNDPNALYTTLTHKQSRQIAKELIDEIGVEKAVLEATKYENGLEPVERTMLLGAAMDFYAGEAKKFSKEGNEKGLLEAADNELDANNKFQEVAAKLATLGTNYGRAISSFKDIYKLSNLALERKLVKKVDEVNKARNENATSEAKDIQNIITEESNSVQGAAQDLTQTELLKAEDNGRKISELEKEVADLKKQILERDNAAKGTKKNPLKIKRVTNDTEYDKRVKEFSQRQRTGISKEDITDLTYFGLYHIENGITKFADWYKVMASKFKGFKQNLPKIYQIVKEKAIENGADETLFDIDEDVDKSLDGFQKESDAKKMVAASKKLASAELKKIEENNPDKARIVAPKKAAERIRKDAERNLDMPSTKVEQTYLKKLVQTINAKAKEYYKETKQNVSNVNDILAFAIANGKSDYKIWERTKEELNRQIEEDKNLTDEQKDEIREFLDDYTESVFDTLLTKNQIDQIIREKLIDAGFKTEKTINGKVVKSVDWSKIIGNSKTIKEAKEKLVKAINDLGFTEKEAKGEINAILDQFDAKVTDKKTADINAYLNKGILNKVKSALGKKKATKNQIGKLIEMNNKGMLDDTRIKEVLAEQLELISLNDADLKRLRDLSTIIDNPNIPDFIRRQFEEDMQYLFDSKGGNLMYLENREAVSANRLSSAYNQIQNTLGFARTISTLLTIAAKTGKPLDALKVYFKELSNAKSDAATILLRGRVSRGSSFSDLTRTTEGEPRTRYLEKGVGKMYGGKGLGKSIYVKLGDKTVDLNVLNQAYAKLKYVHRLLESTDTFSSGAVSGTTQFWQVNKEINRLYPELSSKQKSEKVWDIMYSVDRQQETINAIEMLKNAGVENPTQSEINRTINEKVERRRNEKLAEEFYKQVESVKPIAETKLKDNGIEKPTDEQIQQEAYKMLGVDEPLDVVARGERQAGRETGKSTTWGLSSLLLLPVDAFQKRISNQLRANKSKAGQIVSNSADAVFSQLFPFVNSIARWTEMQIELLPPYGLIKSAAYKSGLARAMQGGDKAKFSKREYSELGDDYAIRSVLGAGYIALGMFGIGLAKRLVGDDDEAEDAVVGTAKKDNFTQERVSSVGKPKQSAKIGSHNIPLQLLGNTGVVLGMYADYLNNKKNPEYEEKSQLYISSVAAMSSLIDGVLDATWFSNASKYGGLATSIGKGKDEKYMPMLGKVAGGLVGSRIPFNRLQTEVATVMTPESKKSTEFGINVANQMSIVRSLTDGKSNFDYRGRTYEYGDIYVNSADGVIKMFSKAKYGDKADEFLSKINFAATDAYRETKEVDNYNFAITQKDGIKRIMNPDEYYDFKLIASKKFDELISNNYQKIDENSDIKVGGVIDKIETLKQKKEISSSLLKYSKEEAFKEVQKKTGYVPPIVDYDKVKKEALIELEKLKQKIKAIGIDLFTKI